MNTKRQVVILSAELENYSDNEKLRATDNLEACLNDLNLVYSNANGRYKDVNEKCFVVIVNNQVELDAVKDLGLDSFKQESVLYQDSNGYSHLIYKDKSEMIGKLDLVSEKQALESQNYVELKGQYYVVI